MAGQLVNAEDRLLAKMKSNFLVHVQSFSRSSISKLQFGGTLLQSQQRTCQDMGADILAGLDRAQIDADDLGFGVSVRWTNHQRQGLKDTSEDT
jgi:hypothetical protein